MALWARFSMRALPTSVWVASLAALWAAPASAQVELPRAPVDVPVPNVVPQDPVGDVTRDPVAPVRDVVGRVAPAPAGPSAPSGGGNPSGDSSPGGGGGTPGGGGASPGPSGTPGSASGPRSGGRSPAGGRSSRRRVGLAGGRRAGRRAGAAGRRADGRRRDGGRRGDDGRRQGGRDSRDPSLRDAVRQIVEVVPTPVKIALGALALLALLLGLGYSRSGLRARRLARQRIELLKDIGLLQAALLPEVPERLGTLGISAAYRPADGPGAGGDFYDAFTIDSDRVAVIVGDVSGHGREALGHTTLVHFTLRAYLEAGLEPRTALQLAGHALGDDLGDDFATVVVARWDAGSGTLSYASAGHPPPIFVPAPSGHEPITNFASPPIGVGLPTGRRQSTVALPAGSVACFHTDGLIEARDGDELLGRERLAGLLEALGRRAKADALLDRVADVSDRTDDDMAACVLSPRQSKPQPPFWVEEVELEGSDARHPELARFLLACGLDEADAAEATEAAQEELERIGGAVLSVRHHDGSTRWEVGPRGVETLLHGTGAPAASLTS